MTDISQDPGIVPGLRHNPIDSHALPASPQNRASEFVAVSGVEAENTSATTMLVAAYSLFWLLLLGFVWMTWRRQQSLAARLRSIESRIASLQSGDVK
jgi:hypothetical protein